MGVDIRFPIGLMFTIFGLVLTILGLVTNSNAEMYKRSLDININLWTGLVVLVFGVLMLIFALKGKKTRKK
ncbi:MAG: hypothetical protein KAU83_08805 [Bacteroidales bacterium]|nr:hypothetical protein [Bacteroidales bacterium]